MKSLSLIDPAFLNPLRPAAVTPHFNRWSNGSPLADLGGANDFSVWLTGMPVMAYSADTN